LISWPQRGDRLRLAFRLTYTNPVYTLTDNRVNGRCPIQCYTWRLGSASNIGAGNGLFVSSDIPSIGEIWSTTTQQQLLLNYTVEESDGAVHQMGETNTTQGTWLSMDATGYGFTSNSPTLVDRFGTAYSYNFNTTPNGYVVPLALTRIADGNGNLIISNLDPNNSANILSLTDTMGRMIPYSGQSTTDYTNCTGTYSTSSAVSWSFPGPNGGQAQFKFCFAAFPLSYTPNCQGYVQCYGLSGNKVQLQSIVLPDNSAWTFEFDSTGALSKITRPTGGSISYTWGQDYTCFGSGANNIVFQFTAYALSRTVDANDGTGPHAWGYAISPLSPYLPAPSSSTAVVTDPSQNDVVHTLTTPGKSSGCSLYETELDEYSGSHTGGTLLRKTVTNYASS
jgi:YD repeat-containing protein